MKFTVKIEGGFKTAHGLFEQGNTHESSKLGIPYGKLLAWREAGWIDIGGMRPGPRAVPGVRSTAIEPAATVHPPATSE